MSCKPEIKPDGLYNDTQGAGALPTTKFFKIKETSKVRLGESTEVSVLSKTNFGTLLKNPMSFLRVSDVSFISPLIHFSYCVRIDCIDESGSGTKQLGSKVTLLRSVNPSSRISEKTLE